MRRILAVVGVVAVVGTLLTGCTPSVGHGVRLNSDGSVDFVFCGPYRENSIAIDYQRSNEYTASPEWTAVSTSTREIGDRLIHFGVTPTGFTTTELDPIPIGWTGVSLNTVYEVRADLEVGVWEWRTSNFAWIPSRPCPGVDPATWATP